MQNEHMKSKDEIILKTNSSTSKYLQIAEPRLVYPCLQQFSLKKVRILVFIHY